MGSVLLFSLVFVLFVFVLFVFVLLVLVLLALLVGAGVGLSVGLATIVVVACVVEVEDVLELPVVVADEEVELPVAVVVLWIVDKEEDVVLAPVDDVLSTVVVEDEVELPVVVVLWTVDKVEDVVLAPVDDVLELPVVLWMVDNVEDVVLAPVVDEAVAKVVLCFDNDKVKRKSVICSKTHTKYHLDNTYKNRRQQKNLRWRRASTGTVCSQWKGR